MAKRRKRGNGAGSVYRIGGKGPYYAAWTDGRGVRRKRSTRTTNRTDAERLARAWAERAALEREGLVKPEGGTELDRHGAAPLADHLDAFEAVKRAEGRSERHVHETRKMIETAAQACGWTRLQNIEAEAFERYIARNRTREIRAWAPRTAGKHVAALRTFTRWCVADGRLAADPVARVPKPAPTRQRERRPLTVEDWRWLRSATEAGPDRAGMSGLERSLLYATAIQTGLRSGELRELRRTSLAIDGEKPHIFLEGRNTKNGKPARQYVKPSLAAELRDHAGRMMPGAAVFNMPGRTHLAKMLRADLAAARAAWIADAGDNAGERIRREGSDFLRATDHDGRYIDFHSLRHTCGTWAAEGGASPKAIQTLMRHSSITLTLDTYGHLLPDEAAETVSRMPDVEAAPLRMTGTTDAVETMAGGGSAFGSNAGARRGDSAGLHAHKKTANPDSVAEKRGLQARRTGLEPATTGSTVRDSNQLSYRPMMGSRD
jgi:integrase